ncbi:MAG: TRAP transporter small permease [Clostridiales bacterium]|nr:TRAP transporter small permease [Clostridiales bacterium]
MDSISSKVVPVVEKLLGLVGVVMILIETFAVFGRNILQLSTPWVDEALKLMFIWIVFVGSALCFRKDELISLTLIEDGLKEKNRMAPYGVMKLLQYIAATGMSALVAYQLTTIISTQMSTGEATTVIKYPLWVMNLGVFVGVLLIVIFGIFKIVNTFKYFKKEA